MVPTLNLCVGAASPPHERIHPFPVRLSPELGVTEGCWSLFQLSQGEGRRHPTPVHRRHKQPFALPHTPTDNLLSSSPAQTQEPRWCIRESLHSNRKYQVEQRRILHEFCSRSIINCFDFVRLCLLLLLLWG